jgi:hypothetical protein
MGITKVNKELIKTEGTVSDFIGVYNATTNTPILSNTDTNKKGVELRVAVAGTQDFGVGDITFGVNDIISNDGLIYYKKVDNNQSGDGSPIPVQKIGTNIVLTEDAEYYVDALDPPNPNTSGNIVIDMTGAVVGVTVGVSVADYIPTISGGSYISRTNTLNGVRDWYYFQNTYEGLKLYVIGEDTLTTPVVTLTPSNTEVLVNWTTSVGATSYTVLRNTTNTIVGATTIYTGALVEFNDTGLTNGTTYYYFVCATGGTGKHNSSYGTNSDQPEAYSTDAFVFNVQTDNTGTSSDTQFIVPTFLNSGSNVSEYNCTVDWGDGNTDTITTYNDSAWTHTYASVGAYRIIITGIFKGFTFNNGGDKSKLVSMEQFGSMSFGNFSSGNYLRACDNLTFTATDSPNTVDTVYCGTFFMDTNFSTIPSINSWGLQPTNMSNMFRGNANFNQDLTGIDTSLCTSFNSLFRGCDVFNGSLIGWDGTSCLNVQQMFDSALAFNQPIDHLVLELCTTFALWFTNADSFDQSLAGIKPVAVTSAISMFNLGSSLSTANYTATLIGWDAHVETLASINYDFDISTYDASAVTPKANLVADGLTFTDGGQV